MLNHPTFGVHVKIEFDMAFFNAIRICVDSQISFDKSRRSTYFYRNLLFCNAIVFEANLLLHYALYLLESYVLSNL